MANENKPVHLMRLGIHAEQKYFIDRPELYDILILNGNIVEYFAKGTASLLAGPLRNRPYFIDPITHSFGHNPKYIMTFDENKRPKGVKKSLQLVSERFGSPVFEAVSQPRALTPADFADIGLMREFTQRVLDFQILRLSEALEEDIKYLDTDEPPLAPILLVAPYFYMDIFNFQDWLPINLSMIKISKEIEPRHRIFGEIVIDRGILDEEEMWKNIAEAYVALEECDGFLIWISDYSEHEASKPQLDNMRLFIEHLSKNGKPIYNLYGGYYSILLYHHGMSGVCHGPGYGENRSVVPVGGGIPKPRYYLTPVHQRLLYTEVQQLIDQGAWKSITQFQDEVCDGEVCRIVLEGNLNNFYRFGEVETRQREDGRFYNVPQPETVERINFHYLEAKANEYNTIASLEINQLIRQLEDAHDKYRKFMLEQQLRYLVLWANAMKS